MSNPRYPELIGETGHRGDTTDGRPPQGIPAAHGQVQGGALNLAASRLAQVPDLAGDLGRRGDLSGGQLFRQPADPYATRRPRDLKSSWEWLHFAAGLPADFLPAPAGATGGLVVSGRQVLLGGNFANSSTVAVTVTIRDGMDASGGFIQQVSVPATGLANLVLPFAGILIELGMFAVYSGAGITGSLYAVHLWKYPFTPPGE